MGVCQEGCCCRVPAVWTHQRGDVPRIRLAMLVGRPSINWQEQPGIAVFLRGCNECCRTRDVPDVMFLKQVSQTMLVVSFCVFYVCAGDCTPELVACVCVCAGVHTIRPM